MRGKDIWGSDADGVGDEAAEVILADFARGVPGHFGHEPDF
jgi:hypothetical protein